ncbi:MAG: 16S rRNA (cytosine(967)-C(5))-methyltransferase RsmB [Lachnospiraceae bacterium]|nr:16S rRNA (cytosine(967)-C(5))-methyltransferase RsmB [Lachnospiraceae bacterium]
MQDRSRRYPGLNERWIVLETLLAIEKGEDFSNRIIQDVLQKYAYLDRQHRSFMKRVMEGCVERKIELDYVIDRFSKTPADKMKPVILCILRMSVYQLLYMDAVPPSAVCNEAVKITQKKGFGPLKGFVNGVLRNIARNKDTIAYPSAETDPVLHDSIVYSMPEELVRHFRTHYGDRAEKIMRSFLKELPLTVRINTSKTGVEQLQQDMEGEGRLVELPLIPDLDPQEKAYRLAEYDSLQALRAFSQGLIQVQDQASMQAVCQIPFKAGDRVLDVCAAPGGKSIQAADILCKLGGGTVTACDVSEKKVGLIRENADRCGFDNLEAVVCDATQRHESYVNSADVLIADLPCSGLATIGRKTDVKYRMSGPQMEELAGLQRCILQNVSDYVKAGGYLLYSTCTLNPAENEEQAAWIEENLPFSMLKKQQIFPDDLHDGFFFALFKKTDK